ncbi:MAG TPA: CocE/NonD family hydrolase [Actinomycetota bacterium]|nr:CocE/NonD family hydrolase [Actinomycetota bacterium]
MRIRTSFVLLLALVASVLPFTTAVADPVPEDATWTQVYFASEDGTMLHADVFLPKDREENERHPVILSIGPYFGSGGSAPPTPTREGPVMRFQDLIDEGKIFKRGYAYIQVDSRGYGGSDGCYDLGGAGEQMDAASAVEWAAEQAWSNGRVGMWGKSYDAWTQVMALAHKPKGLEAAIIQSPLIEGYKGFFMNGVHYDAGWYATPGLYGDYDLTPPSANDSPPEEFIYPAKGTATNPDCYANNGTQAAIGDHSTDYWMERDIREAAGASTVPVLWSHGFLDANTKPDNFMDVWTALQGPKRGWFGQYDHVRGNEDKLVGRDGFMNEAMAWLDHYLKGLPLKRFPATEIQDSNGEWRKEAAWPPRDAKLHRFRLKAGEYTDDPMNSADSPGDGIWSFTPRAPYDLHFAGLPELSVDVTDQLAQANLVALVYDVDPKGDARLITRGASLVGEDERLTFELYPEDWRLAKGHRFGVFISGSDSSWFTPTHTGATVAISKGAIQFPFLRFKRRSNLEGRPAQAMQNVPEPMIEKDVIKANTVKGKFPPRLKRRR